jgi:predicted nucleotidyltransferase
MPSPLLESLRGALADRPDVALAVVFGSVARGCERADSDVDLAVIAPGVDTLDLAAALSLALAREIDVVDLAEPGYPLLKSIVRDGIVVHEGHRGAGAQWRSRAIASLETDRPWFERMRDAYLATLSAGR